MPRSKLFQTHGPKPHDNINKTEPIEFPSGSPVSSSSTSESSADFPPPSTSFERRQELPIICVDSDHDSAPTILIHGTNSESSVPKESSHLSLIKTIAKKASMKRLRSVSRPSTSFYHQHDHVNHNRDTFDSSLSSSTSHASTLSTSIDSPPLNPPSYHRTRLLSLPSFHRRSRTSPSNSEQTLDPGTSNFASGAYDSYDGYSVPSSQRSFEVLSRPRRAQSQNMEVIEQTTSKRDLDAEIKPTTNPTHSIVCCRCGSEVHNAATVEVSKEFLGPIDSDAESDFATKDVQSGKPLAFESNSDENCQDIPSSSSSSSPSFSNVPGLLDLVQTTNKDAEASRALECTAEPVTDVDIPTPETQKIASETTTEANHTLLSSPTEASQTNVTIASPRQNPKTIHPGSNSSDEVIPPPFLVGPFILDELAMPILSGTRPLSFFFRRIFWGSLWRDVWHALTRKLQVDVRRRISVYLTWWLSRVTLLFPRGFSASTK
ncbi:hypothetical protein F5876DRAFT_72151 [Lentinula aff. lateritia]|uniref:Uncharacterized protein n=1 Tax=Lentinula aff. lateritia TaxID=2804960 RepID=A0ACC1UEL8_9AGAR|nr:hypothetical protein F5876DRAFT_72151 [Lentinula aff. lateritia]